MEKFPDIFIVGAPRCGTTYLASVLEQHPEIFMCPVKEPHYFAFPDISLNDFRPALRKRIERFDLNAYLNQKNKNPVHRLYITRKEDYLKLFEQAPPNSLLAEASPSYLWAEGAAQRIRHANPQARIIIMIRNPVERAISQYFIERKMGMTRRSVTDDISFDLTFPVRKWGAAPLYVELGLYSKPVSRYIHLFGKENVFIGLLDNLNHHPDSFFENLFSFLNLLPVNPQPATVKRNKGEVPRIDWLNRLRHLPLVKSFQKKILKGNAKTKLKKWFFEEETVDEIDSVKNLLLPIFEPDIIELEKITGFDLSDWRK